MPDAGNRLPVKTRMLKKCYMRFTNFIIYAKIQM